jgi:hypothetical protein
MVMSVFAGMVFLCASAMAQSSDALVVDENGRVGIGTASPVRRLSVERTDTATDGIRVTTDRPVLELIENEAPPSFGAFRWEVSSGSLRLMRNTSETTPFSTGSWDLTVDQSGNIGIATAQFGTSAARVLGLRNGTAPTSSPADMIQLYAIDYIDTADPQQTASSELFVRDEDGSAVDLSPHIFALFLPDAAEPFPWSYYAENSYLGKTINVDMAGAIRAIERLSGKQFIFYKDIPRADIQKEKREEWKKDWIAKNTTEQEVSKDEALESVEVTVEDTGKVISEKVSYALEGRDVVEIRTPVYAQKAEQKWQLKRDARFDTDTGKFFMKTVPTDADAEAAASAHFQLVVKKWIRDRL